MYSIAFIVGIALLYHEIWLLYFDKKKVQIDDKTKHYHALAYTLSITLSLVAWLIVYKPVILQRVNVIVILRF